jgi:CotH protein
VKSAGRPWAGAAPVCGRGASRVLGGMAALLLSFACDTAKPAAPAASRRGVDAGAPADAAVTPAGDAPGSGGDAGAEHGAGGGQDASSSTTPAAGPPGDAGSTPASPGAPVADVAPEDLQLDVFGAVGNRFWIDASEQQVALMNAPFQPSVAGPFEGDLYNPYSPAPITFADHLFATTAGEPPHSADFGKVQVKLIGQSTGRPWTVHSLPNFKIDADEFVAKNRIGGVEHLRLNNAIVGNIFREKLALDLYRALGYPAPRASHAWVSGSVWGPEVRVPYVAVEAYERHFCTSREAELGGGCVNMWELSGDLGGGALGVPDNCQLASCDPTRGLALEAAVTATPHGDGYEEALASWLDWDAFHRFQCLSWILQTGDDALHNLNNLVLVERVDGKFQLLPYSVDLSFGQSWPHEVRLGGHSALAAGCQSDGGCWAETIATCESLIDAFAAADPVGKLDALHARLAEAGMLRDGDDDLYQELRSRIEQRLDELPIELEANRDGAVGGACPYPLVQCGEACVDPAACPACEPDAGAGGPACLP